MHSKNVLIVDDDDSIIKLFSLVGKKLGLNIIAAENGLQGFKSFSFYDFFMAITDLNMPKMDGVELIQKVRKIPKYRNFPFLIISGNLSDFDSRVAFLERVDIKEKPIKKDEIESIFKKKLLQFDDNAKTINEIELFGKIITALKNPCELLLTIVTKSKPSLKEVSVNESNLFINNDFFTTFSCTMGGNKITLIFTFDSKLATAINAGVVTRAENQDSPIPDILNSLYRALNPLVIKVFESVGFPLDYSQTRIPLIIGSDVDPTVYTYDLGEFKKSLLISNAIGAMQVYILHEH